MILRLVHLNYLLFVDWNFNSLGNLYYLIFIHWNLDRLGDRNRIWNLNRNRDLHMFLADLLNHLSALFIVLIMFYNFIISLTLLLKSLDTFLLGNINCGLITNCFYASPE